MFRKLFSFLVIFLIGVQIPGIVVLSGAQTASSKIAEVEASIEQVAESAKPAGIVSGAAGILGGITKVVTKPVSAVPVVGTVTEGIGSILAGPQANLAEVKSLLNNVRNGMYISIALTLLLILMLALINVGAFLKNLGSAFILGGILTLINAGLLYYFFIVNFDPTFTFFYQMAASGSFVLGLPFVASIVKSFAKDFVISIANILVMRSVIVGILVFGAGMIALFLGKKRRRIF